MLKIERETIINFNEAEATASVYTYNGALRRRLEKLAEERPEECKMIGSGQAADYIIPKGWIKINPTRQMSEEQRKILAERAKANFS